MVGADQPQMVVGKNVCDLIAPEDRDRFRSFNERICDGDKGALEFDLIAIDGTRRHMETHAVPLRSTEGTLVQLAVTRDVTERRSTQERLRKTEKLAAAGQLAASLAHEINNPLSAVTNAVYLLKNDSSLTPDVRHLVSISSNELARLTRIVRQSLSYYRTGLPPRDVNLGEIVDESLEVFKGKLERAGIHLRKKFLSDGSIFGFGDEIRQIIDNLLLNAIEAMPRGGRLGVSVRPYSSGSNPTIRLTIADSGPGIRRQLQPKIFEPFFTTKAEKGTGLGLWVVHGLVTKHEATIRVRSSDRAGRSGTVVTVLWPMSAHRDSGRFPPSLAS